MFRQEIASNQYGIVKYKPNLFRDEDGWLRSGWFVSLVMTGLAAFIAVVALTVTHFGIVSDRNACITQGHAMNRDVRFVRLTFGSDVCLAKTKTGEWIDINNIRSLMNGN
jgi:hypothetical protein